MADTKRLYFNHGLEYVEIDIDHSGERPELWMTHVQLKTPMDTTKLKPWEARDLAIMLLTFAYTGGLKVEDELILAKRLNDGT